MRSSCRLCFPDFLSIFNFSEFQDCKNSRNCDFWNFWNVLGISDNAFWIYFQCNLFDYIFLIFYQFLRLLIFTIWNWLLQTIYVHFTYIGNYNIEAIPHFGCGAVLRYGIAVQQVADMHSACNPAMHYRERPHK